MLVAALSIVAVSFLLGFIITYALLLLGGWFRTDLRLTLLPCLPAAAFDAGWILSRLMIVVAYC